MAPDWKSNDNDNSGNPKKHHEMLPLCYIMKILDLVVKEKNSFVEQTHSFS